MASTFIIKNTLVRNLLIPLSILLTFSACQESPQEDFDKEGISIISLPGWKITDREDMDGEGYYLVIEKDGFNSSGLISLTWLNNELDLSNWISLHQDEMKSNFIYKNSDLSFTSVTQAQFNNIPTQSVSFTASILNIKHEGKLHVFYKNGKTFSVLRQEAIEDKPNNKKGFDLIEKSFQIISN